ncbi:type 1 glutamine amidotransferase [Leisingera sp. McT4-56]|uniref:type 1 glutamine amidotransferase n=1 Tax=Leisingera sp. McT4-56 TaxID=2881255 RepID=UPI001CF88F80|nr:gamma-glutamyl-gamma-aminobutyrate hydrolase family protein [Leisingera sp. McT4-56]MCB4457723.1 gamma-glutamyl-gamma-aminobutyrate hydrolase family protein [Leisingera sp. McT4-56]
MHLAILMTNTDESEFAQRHPKDGEKFTDLIQMARPGWRTTVFSVKDGDFPQDLFEFDGAMITGSPASVRSGAPWVTQLLELIHATHSRQFPLFGACFGHQAIAMALGGSIDRNPDGWVHGLTRNQLLHRPEWAAPLPDEVKLYGSHCECVRTLPDGATPMSERGGMNTGFTLARNIFTTQHHPEMTHEFIIALCDEMRDELGPAVYARALDSLEEQSDQQAFAESLARFFEQAIA